MLKEALIEKGIMFEERDLDNTNVYAELVMRDIHILSAPAIEIKGIMFIYYK
jgi:glutaredoxin